MNAKRFKALLHARKVKVYFYDQKIDENGQTHIWGLLVNSRR